MSHLHAHFFHKLKCLWLWTWCLQDYMFSQHLQLRPVLVHKSELCVQADQWYELPKYMQLSQLLKLQTFAPHKTQEDNTSNTAPNLFVNSLSHSISADAKCMLQVYQETKAWSCSIDVSVFLQRCVSAHADAVWAQAGCDFFSMSLFNFLAVSPGFQQSSCSQTSFNQSYNYGSQDKVQKALMFSSWTCLLNKV